MTKSLTVSINGIKEAKKGYNFDPCRGRKKTLRFVGYFETGQLEDRGTE
jgi:hypothetical protein